MDEAIAAIVKRIKDDGYVSRYDAECIVRNYMGHLNNFGDVMSRVCNKTGARMTGGLYIVS